MQPQARQRLHDILMAPSKADADRALELFPASRHAQVPKAAACLAPDRAALDFGKSGCYLYGSQSDGWGAQLAGLVRRTAQ